MKDLQILERKNFKAIDFFNSETARKNKINNFCDNQTILENLSIIADKIQEIRNLFDRPVIINSAYRNPQVNKLVGGSKYSQHMYGQAIDFVCPGFGTPQEIVLYMKNVGIEVDQCLIEKGWVHLSVKKRGNRNQFGTLINGVFRIISTNEV
tara:strand:- start:229 stop:684 length:456 start_codon:yes stop_codon:yes gene_type:complete